MPTGDADPEMHGHLASPTCTSSTEINTHQIKSRGPFLIREPSLASSRSEACRHTDTLRLNYSAPRYIPRGEPWSLLFYIHLQGGRPRTLWRWLPVEEEPAAEPGAELVSNTSSATSHPSDETITPFSASCLPVCKTKSTATKP